MSAGVGVVDVRLVKQVAEKCCVFDRLILARDKVSRSVLVGGDRGGVGVEFVCV